MLLAAYTVSEAVRPFIVFMTLTTLGYEKIGNVQEKPGASIALIILIMIITAKTFVFLLFLVTTPYDKNFYHCSNSSHLL